MAEGVRTVHPAGLVAEAPWDIYQDYIDGRKEIREINMEYMEKYRQDRQIHWEDLWLMGSVVWLQVSGGTMQRW